MTYLSPQSGDIKLCHDELQVSRFRPNILVRGVNRSHAEDEWRSIDFLTCREDTLPMLTMNVIGPCSRCKMININQKTGIIDGRYLQTLAEYRKIGSRINFGLFTTLNESAQLKVNDTSKLLYENVDFLNANDSKLQYIHEGMIVLPHV
jgi:uncharacterized protein YcbX